MTREEFEAAARRDGYELREAEVKPDEHRPAHTHPWDARLFILEGAFTLVFGDQTVVYRPGDVCEVRAGTVHEEHTGASGTRYVATRRAAA